MSAGREKYVWDTSALISMARSHDPFHLSCIQFMKEHKDDVHIFPAIGWFEWQSTLSRIEREGSRVLRDLYVRYRRRGRQCGLSRDRHPRARSAD
jgi:hypothetical protein